MASPGWRGPGGASLVASARGALGLLCAAVVALAGSAADASEPAGLPRLMGIVVAGRDRVALFAGVPTLLVHEGDMVGDERVMAIDAWTVRLDGPSGPHLVTPSADPANRATPGNTTLPAPIVDPYRRERDIENDQ